MKQKVWGLSLGLMLCTGALYADEGTTSQRTEPDGRAKLASIEAVQQTDAEAAPRKRRFTIGGYGEAVYSYNFYSDNYLLFIVTTTCATTARRTTRTTRTDASTCPT